MCTSALLTNAFECLAAGLPVPLPLLVLEFLTASVTDEFMAIQLLDYKTIDVFSEVERYSAVWARIVLFEPVCETF